MIIWGHYNRDRHEDTGRFTCPKCADARDFTLIRTWRYFHIYFIPLARQSLVAEQIVCQQCGIGFPITVLTDIAGNVSSAFDAGCNASLTLASHFGNILQFTDAAIEEIRLRHAKGRFEEDVVVRVEPDSSGPRVVRVAFDIALADGRDWIGESHGIPIVVDRAVAPELQGATVDFDDGQFVRK